MVITANAGVFCLSLFQRSIFFPAYGAEMGDDLEQAVSVGVGVVVKQDLSTPEDGLILRLMEVDTTFEAALLTFFMDLERTTSVNFTRGRHFPQQCYGAWLSTPFMSQKEQKVLAKQMEDLKEKERRAWEIEGKERMEGWGHHHGGPPGGSAGGVSRIQYELIMSYIDFGKQEGATLQLAIHHGGILSEMRIAKRIYSGLSLPISFSGYTAIGHKLGKY
ncbi:hypothetical protein FPV67DRAFT_1670318 [Lyophyllum atratum]|nr:hypothetical protein FPV67DRAFT_1670318 [Lyophyllum atratum]